MKISRISSKKLINKIIDVHSHIGVSLGSYATLSYPYAQTLEGLYYRQKVHNIDINVVFPYSSDLYADLKILSSEGAFIPAEDPLSPFPFAVENRIIFKEIFEFCPELSHRFLPFICIDPGRAIGLQKNEIEKLEKLYPIYGIKVSGVSSQIKVIKLLSESSIFLDYAESRNIPILFHTTPTPDDEYSHVSDIIKIIEKKQKIRFCLAHCILFNRNYLDIAAQAPNVWVDTSALKIQIDCLKDYIGSGINKKDVIDADFTDYRKVIKVLYEKYPNTIIWGTDSPAYSYITKRKQGKNMFRNFIYKGTYEDEIAALKSLPKNYIIKISNKNTIKFLFGKNKNS